MHMYSMPCSVWPRSSQLNPTSNLSIPRLSFLIGSFLAPTHTAHIRQRHNNATFDQILNFQLGVCSIAARKHLLYISTTHSTLLLRPHPLPTSIFLAVLLRTPGTEYYDRESPH
ncbi:hypothetical protein DL98DRAFT_230588 [Cadophora sp. DSE1049]|nr:hypothetical protein DL98DRAFT_230588 [Cadophora sp. DSE1049]